MTKTITCIINGETKTVQVDVQESLLELLRDRLHLTGTKKGCEVGECGACTVAVDGMVFHEPVFVGDEVSCYGELVKTGRTSMTVRIEAWRRHLHSDEVRKVTQAVFTYVAIGEDRRPRPLPPAT